ncbi:MAG: hypothetical protein KBD01_12080 [Acidobacteria bacterium]|nr:hypothetical protein [Acidobacteriota bacterium]
MNERTTQSSPATPARAEEGLRRLRPVDGFVVGGDVVWGSGQNLWLLLSRPGERLIDFFLEDDDQVLSRDPIPCACAGVLPDGKLLIGQVNWELDRFLSEMLDEQDSARR